MRFAHHGAFWHAFGNTGLARWESYAGETRDPLVACLTLAWGAGCSVKKYAINQIGDLLSSGDSIYETEENITLVGEALPFSLKLVESLLQESPDHRGLLLAASRGFVLYSYAWSGR